MIAANPTASLIPPGREHQQCLADDVLVKAGVDGVFREPWKSRSS
jgi:hypothetical protein